MLANGISLFCMFVYDVPRNSETGLALGNLLASATSESAAVVEPVIAAILTVATMLL